MKDVDIFVVANNHRKSLISQYLQDVDHTVLLTPDYELPDGWVAAPGCSHLTHNHTGAYRCFRGHLDAFKASKKPVILVLEDDAVPNIESWVSLVVKAKTMLKDFEYVSLHSRQYDLSVFDRIKYKGANFYKPRGTVWAVATLAYLIRGELARSFVGSEYTGLPLDLFYYQRLKYCILHPSPFNHDQREGSLIDVT